MTTNQKKGAYKNLGNKKFCVLVCGIGTSLSRKKGKWYLSFADIYITLNCGGMNSHVSKAAAWPQYVP